MVFLRALPCKPVSFIRLFSSHPVSRQISPFARRLFKIPTAPSAPSQNHHDLPSFLSYAERTTLPEASTTYVGTHYEYTVLKSLRRFAFDLHRVGGRDDAGIDLVGTWHVPGQEYAPLRVVIQCKALKTKLGPNLVRELEGAFRHSPVGWRTMDKLAILVSPREATKGVRDTLRRSTYPLFWIMMDCDGVIRQVLWNPKAGEMGLAPLRVDMRYSRVSSATDEPTQPEAVLTWNEAELMGMECLEKGISRKEAEWLALWGCEDSSYAAKSALLEMVEATFPDINPGAADYEQEALFTKKAEFLALLKEKFAR
ncbi:hypothetical protein BGW36DRAFT_367001 [Talaromyces proteolyticus]|uniref:Restriction endonuclease type IV Mrr domain-containing protein n=1 Tax=Talaromyces proteolyticus TaxID=1131652 RepID=A0AAD4L0A4_9EURO|nr:uncharacterized protein BGW36DRAFT_367001 [Talaromyces proteolyticus]KAH8705167.1 hypothetical protein BGW36DRAFT_367001 [Talaromyces proteolyticus]